MYGFGGAANDYALEVARAGCEGPICVDDDFEENDVPAEAMEIVPGDVYEGLAVCGDADWYAIEVCGDGVLSVLAAFRHADGDLD